MYLLNEETILRYVKNRNNSPLQIEDFDKNKLKASAYYFGLGKSIRSLSEPNTGSQLITELKGNTSYPLEPNQYIVVESLERFELSERIFGIFGAHSNFISSGLELVHSPFIDPNFKQKLRLGIGNRSNRTRRLELGMEIGKVTFFDVSDTYPIIGEILRNG